MVALKGSLSIARTLESGTLMIPKGVQAILPVRKRDVGELSAFFGMLFRKGGYMAVHVDVNVWPTLREVLFLRLYC